jgi:Asp-tRNA(Asn)/Glu-tRNA(Gln) amidotransferase A subunit family amidase
MAKKKPAPVEHPIIQIGVMGESGSGKTTFADTLPKPAIVLSFDPRSKAMPYLHGAKVTEEVDEDGVRVLVAERDTGTTYVELYSNTDADTPDAWNRLRRRLRRLGAEIEEWGIKTVILDSATFAALAARKYSQHILNKAGADKVHYMYATDELEDVILGRLIHLNCNFVCLFHIDTDKDEMQGMMIRNAMMPGRLRASTPGGFGEFYRAYAHREGATARERAEADPVHLLQTRPNESYNATTQIHPPDPCEQHYEALWVGQKEEDVA